jgi:hypothetical protein
MDRSLKLMASALVCFGAIGCSGGTSTGSTEPTHVPAAHDVVTSLPQWSRLRVACTEGRSKLESEVRAAHRSLQQHGVGQTYPRLMRHLRESTPFNLGLAAPSRCTAIIGAFVEIKDRRLIKR